MPASRNTADPDFPGAAKILVHEVPNLRHDQGLDIRKQGFDFGKTKLVINDELQRVLEYTFSVLIRYFYICREFEKQGTLLNVIIGDRLLVDRSDDADLCKDRRAPEQ